METLLRVSIDSRPLPIAYGNFSEGSKLEVAISKRSLVTHGGFYAVETPLAHYQPDHDAIRRQDGAEIDLGELPSVTHRQVALFTRDRMEADMLYDFFYLHHKHYLDSGRVVTGAENPPIRLTLEEVALTAVLYAGLTLDQVRGVKATVINDEVLLFNRRQFLHNGLQIGEIVVTISNEDPLALLYVPRDQTKYLEETTRGGRVNQQRFADHLRELAGLPPQVH